MDKENILLGAVDVYYMEYTGELPDDETIEVPENLLGETSGGTTIEYKPSYYTAKSDSGRVTKTILTDEEATLKSGIMTLNGKKLAVLCSTARVEESNNIRTVKIGGVKNYNGKKYVIHCVLNDPEAGKSTVTIVGTNEAGFSLAYQKDKETVVDAEFKANPVDNEGTLIVYKEELSTDSEADAGEDQGEEAQG